MVVMAPKKLGIPSDYIPIIGSGGTKTNDNTQISHVSQCIDRLNDSK